MGSKEYDELKQRRDEAARKAVEAREKADRLDAEANKLKDDRDKKESYWQGLEDSLGIDREKAEEKTQALRLEIELLRDENHVLEKAREEKDSDLDEEEEKQAKQQAEELAVAKEKLIEESAEGLRKRKEYNEQQKKPFDEADEKWKEAREKADLAIVEADEEEEKAIAAEEAATKVRCWLGWDGLYAAAGTCNQSYDETKTSRAVAERRTNPVTEEALAKRLDANLAKEVSFKLQVDKVSVRIASCSDPFVPVHERAVVAIDLKRVTRIKSLLFRVLDKDSKVVYQEVLGEEHIDRLPRASGRAACHHQPFAERYDAAGGLAVPGLGPYTVSVWVSKAADAFKELKTDAVPEEKHGSQASDRTAPKKEKEIPAGPGVNQTTPKQVRPVAAALMVMDTNHRDGRQRDQRSVEDKVQELEDAIAAANQAFGRDPLPSEVRVLLAPEWSFQTAVAAKQHLYTSTERDEVIDKVKALSDTEAANRWLVCPGTILWGMENKKLGITAAFNTVVLAAAGDEVFRYHKKSWGSDVSPGDPGRDRMARGNERRHAKLNSRKLPASIAEEIARLGVKNKEDLKNATVEVLEKDKRWKVTAGGRSFLVFEPAHKVKTVTPSVFWANDLDDTGWKRRLPDGVAHQDYLLTHFFTHRDLKIGVEICADHKAGRGATDYRTAANPGRGDGKDAGVDLHLVTSCYVDFTAWKTVARTGGYAIQCDGSKQIGDGWQVTARGESVAEVGRVNAEARKAADEEMAKAEKEKREPVLRATSDPGGRENPAARVAKLEPEVVDKGAYKLHLLRLAIVDP